MLAEPLKGELDSTVNRTMQTFRAALYHARDDPEAFIKPNLKFGITKERWRSAK
jgi:hypothetical protein